MKNITAALALLLAIYRPAIAQTIVSDKPDTFRVELFNKENIEKLSAEIMAENKKLADRLSTLEKDFANRNDITATLINANQEKYRSSVNNLANRYQAGEQVITHIVKETNQFNLSFSQLLLQNEFSALADPTNYAEFNKSINYSLEILGDKKVGMFANVFNMDDLKQIAPVINNPIISTSFSLISYFLASYYKKEKLKTENFKKLTCILDYTNQIKSEYQIVAAGLKNLNARLDAFRDASKQFFSEYLEAINYGGGYDRYVNDKNTLAYDFMAQQRNLFFNSLLSDAGAIGITNFETNRDDNIQFHIEQVKFYLNEYELLLLEINDFISSYEKFVEKQRQMNADVCSEFSGESSAIFKRIQKTLGTVKYNFDIVYRENRIDKNTKRILFGF
ncbi:hypothetical protein C7N43_22950 [Sphingobacteriales bacterium UPWRP_1]|nr:hypothetical protein B6N25_15005 [Sphingobacteriales bacterium TSM_CSS]PSJ74651.1 hypothetical protein C7N43_22950 [Sphingobacteriales bacterium UPWRP_1]